MSASSVHALLILQIQHRNPLDDRSASVSMEALNSHKLACGSARTASELLAVQDG